MTRESTDDLDDRTHPFAIAISASGYSEVADQDTEPDVIACPKRNNLLE
jgi:hypothetical protein